jgi:hypothetical protein
MMLLVVAFFSDETEKEEAWAPKYELPKTVLAGSVCPRTKKVSFTIQAKTSKMKLVPNPLKEQNKTKQVVDVVAVRNHHRSSKSLTSDLPNIY